MSTTLHTSPLKAAVGTVLRLLVSIHGDEGERLVALPEKRNACREPYSRTYAIRLDFRGTGA